GGTPYGVTVRGGTSNNIIGGTSAASRNVIGGNISSGAGVWIEDVGSDSNLVVGNFLGVNKNGTGAVSNFFGVYVTNAAKDNQIGGATLAERNLISGNTGYGVFLQSAGTSGNKVYGNYIGVDISGTSKLQNDVYGVNIDNASGNIVGGAGMGNIISGNVNAGINFNSSASGNIIQGNAIGTNAGGVTNLGNTSTGISFNSTSTNNLIGGTGAGEGNVIAFNGGYGITVVPGCTQNAILGNDFYSNGNIGIDLRSNPFVGGVSANDANDSDTGGNDMQNFPVLTAASVDGGNITVEGTLSTEPGTAGRLYRVEFFGVVTPDGTNFGEGDSYLFGVDVSVNTLGNGTINTTFPGSVAVGAFISATATSPDSNTSEFSQVIEVADGSLPVSLSGFSAQVSGGTVRLSWSTFSETNNAGFELWRKGEQESEYRLVGSYRVDSSLEGLGTSPVGRDYLFEDRTVVAGASYSYRLADVDYNGVVSFHPPLRVMVTEGGPAEGFRLYPNFPNPFNAGTVIQYEVPGGPEDTHALSLNIFNIRGQLVKTLVEDYQAPGSYQVEWKGRDQYGNPIGSGVYFLVMQSGPHRLTRRLVLLQ
ncbi:MAG: T9SS type A sorting domain-containing protein, partial [Calditrichaeota bacterium]|nr:T9SS type A sorting domain-containing protein [Calditrichota bacterium]